MNRSQIYAIVITFLVFFTAIYFLFGGRINIDLSGIKERIASITLFSEKGEVKKKSSGSIIRKSSAGSVGKVLDSYKGVKIYENGRVRNVSGRNVTPDGYNLGLKYQCVEFVKRFYYEYYDHKMPNSYGNAKDFFKTSLGDAQYNKERGLRQFSNGSSQKPIKNSILVFGATPYNPFGHVAIISKVLNDKIEIVQQNPGQGIPVREMLKLSQTDGKWRVDDPYVVGWLAR